MGSAQGLSRPTVQRAIPDFANRKEMGSAQSDPIYCDYIRPCSKMVSRKNYKSKPVSDLQLEDMEHAAVWKYVYDGPDETYVTPVLEVPVASLEDKVVCTKVTLANGAQVWATVGNVNEKSPYSTSHFLTLAVFHSGRRFVLARYHDLDYNSSGPVALAAFLGLSPAEVFPIHYDISFAVKKGDAHALIGDIEQEPKERLPSKKLIKLAVGGK